MATAPFGNTATAAFIPTWWSMKVLTAYEVNALLANLVDRSYEADLGEHNSGNTINVTPVSNINSATARTKSFNTTVTVDNQTETNVAISLDTHVYQASAFEDIATIQSRVDVMSKYTAKLGYTIAKKVDSDIASKFASLTNNRGTLNVNVTEAVLQNAMLDLDANNVPDENRFWIFSVQEKPNLATLDSFINRDYQNFGMLDSYMVRSKKMGEILDVPVYVTTNLTANASGHDNALLHKECIALVMQLKPRVQSQYQLKDLYWLVLVDTIYGIKIMRDTDGGTWVKGK